VKALRPARYLRDTDGDGVQEENDFYYACIEPRASRSREPSGRDLNDRNIGVLSGNHIRPLIRKTIGVTLFQRSAYVCMKKGCYADSRALVGSYLETIYT